MEQPPAVETPPPAADAPVETPAASSASSSAAESSSAAASTTAAEAAASSAAPEESAESTAPVGDEIENAPDAALDGTVPEAQTTESPELIAPDQPVIDLDGLDLNSELDLGNLMPGGGLRARATAAA
jgi:hypothetical protein